MFPPHPWFAYIIDSIYSAAVTAIHVCSTAYHHNFLHSRSPFRYLVDCFFFQETILTMVLSSEMLYKKISIM